MTTAHPDQLEFFADVIGCFPEQFAGAVLDIGSMDINGGPHTLINPRHYVGVDLIPGPNVTVVGRSQELDLPSASFSVAMSSECFEHDPDWRTALRVMIDATAEGGVVVVSCATRGRREHGTTRADGGFASPGTVALGQEHYANVGIAEVAAVIRHDDFDRWYALVNGRRSDLYVVGLRPGASEDDLSRMADLATRLQARYHSRPYRADPIVAALLGLTGERGLACARRLFWRLP